MRQLVLQQKMAGWPWCRKKGGTLHFQSDHCAETHAGSMMSVLTD